jgi:hypothetical protein
MLSEKGVTEQQKGKREGERDGEEKERKRV